MSRHSVQLCWRNVLACIGMLNVLGNSFRKGNYNEYAFCLIV